MKYQFAGLITMIALSGCAVTAVDLGGSKSDGTVIVGANVGEFESVDWSGTQARAKRRCIAWGYRDADAFEGIRTRCVAHAGFVSGFYGTSGCAEWEVSRTFQCIE